MKPHTLVLHVMHYFLRACGLCYLEDFDLAAARVQVLRVLSAFILFKGVDLDTKRNSFFSTVFPRGELCTDAVNLHEESGRKENQRGTQHWLLKQF